MTDIAMDPEAMDAHAEAHQEIGESVIGALDAIPAEVDGGLAADTVVAIMTRIGDGLDALYRVNGTLGEIVTAIKDDATTTEEEAVAQLAPIAAEVEEIG